MEVCCSCTSSGIRSPDFFVAKGLGKVSLGGNSNMSLLCQTKDEGLTIRTKKNNNIWKKKNNNSSNMVIRASSSSSSANEESSSSSHAGDNNVEMPSINPSDSEDSGVRVIEHMSALIRLTYGIGIYGVMALAGKGICCFTGVDSIGGLGLSTEAVINGLGFAVPPMMTLLFILDDEIVKLCPYARAIRDVEDEELMNFFLGMSPWQFLLIVSASSVGEELFYRVAVQGGLAHVFMSETLQNKNIQGVASLTGIFPAFVPFAQAFAAVLTAALTGSLYYMAASPKDPTYIVAPIPRSRGAMEDMKKRFTAWYERRQLKKIYSPLLESLLALYLGLEWIQTNNILAPIITHAIYSGVVLGHGLWRIQDQRKKLRERIRKIWRKKAL